MVNFDTRDFDEDVSLFTVYRAFVMQQKTIAMVVNKFRIKDTLMSGLVWVPAKNSDEFIMKKDSMNN